MTKPDALLKHARKYGTEGVAEVAVDLGYGLTALTDLLIALDALDQDKKPRIAQRHKKIDLRAVFEARAQKMLGITDETPEAA